MAKSLGQIHTANFEISDLAIGNRYLLDTAGALASQLGRQVRFGNYFKTVGIDMTLRNRSGTAVANPTPVSGVIRYYAPTRGRCNAFKKGFHAVREGMKLQGINVRGNKNYDFRPLMNKSSVYQPQPAASFLNAATIDGTNELVLNDGLSTDDSIFEVYNSNIQPQQDTAVNFQMGFGLPGGTTGTDYVLNEGEVFDPSQVLVANTTPEEIPFTLEFGYSNVGGTSGTSAAMNFDWQPDPALYLSVMTGQFEILIDGGVPVSDHTIEIAIHIAGWKSIMGNPDRKRRSSKKKSTSKKKGAKK